MGFLKRVCVIFVAIIFCSSGVGGNTFADSSKVSKKIEGIEEVSLSKAESKIRDASVVVRDPLTGSYGSGTFFRIEKKNIVITAAHVVDSLRHVEVIGRANEKVIGTVIYVDPRFDFAMITIPDMISRTPVKFKPHKEEDLVGTNVTYTGHPAHHDLLTVRGRVVGKDERTQSILMHSYAWMGSSGSCVFSLDGKLVGVLFAVDVGRYDGRQIVEDIVWITPISSINLENILLSIRVHGIN